MRAVGFGLVLCLILGLARVAGAVPEAVEAEGSGSTRESAIAAALSSAVEQVTGVAVATRRAAMVTLAARATDDSAEVVVSDSAQDEISRNSGGVIRRYRVLDVSVDRYGAFVARIAAEVEKFEPKGGDGDSRSRLAVVSFRAAGRGSSATDAQGSLLRDRLTQWLAQSRRFAIVDRANDAAVRGEMELIAGPETPLAEKAKLGQALGADYLVLGTFASQSAVSDRMIAMTGEHVHSERHSLTIDYQVLDAATRQVKWGGTVKADSGLGGEGLLDALVAQIGAQITEAIYPMRIIQADGPGALIINQGGATLQRGQRLRAFALGRELVDPYTHERLGQAEREIGIVEIQRVDNKLSYGRLVSGRLPEGEQAMVLRRMGGDQPQSAPAARQPAQTQPIRLPQDR